MVIAIECGHVWWTYWIKIEKVWL